MPFKFKDLMINVLPVQDIAQACKAPTCNCVSYAVSHTIHAMLCPPVTQPCYCASHPVMTQPCFCVSQLVMSHLPCGCTAIASIPTPWYQTPDPGYMAALKEQLKQSLAQVEEQEAAVERALKPQTAEEAEALEQKLTEALTELRRIKEDLKKR